MIDLATIAELLDHLGVKHAPEQHFLNEPDKVDGRYVTLRDPPGVYYILGTDNDQLTSEVQLIFLEPPFAGDIGLPPELSEEVRAAITPRVDRYAGSIGYKVKKIEAIPSDKGSIPSAILEPRF